MGTYPSRTLFCGTHCTPITHVSFPRSASGLPTPTLSTAMPTLYIGWVYPKPAGIVILYCVTAPFAIKRIWRNTVSRTGIAPTNCPICSFVSNTAVGWLIRMLSASITDRGNCFQPPLRCTLHSRPQRLSRTACLPYINCCKTPLMRLLISETARSTTTS